jgi:hypothetical protein
LQEASSSAAMTPIAAAASGFLQCAACTNRSVPVWLIVLEALLALGLLIFIVWWTMFHGRKPPDE